MFDSAAENPYYPRFVRGQQPLRWPGGKPLMLAIVVSVEYYDLYAPPGSIVPTNVPGGFGRAPYPDVRAFSMRDYGARVGFSRILQTLARRGVKATLAADAHTASERTVVVTDALSEDWSIIGHGMSGTHVVSSMMREDEERAYIQQSIGPLSRLCGRSIAGWHGAEYGQSANSARLLAEAGIRYMLDWPNDDRPVSMTVPRGSMLAIPMSADLDDVFAHWGRRVSMDRWFRSVLESIDQLAMEGVENGSLLVLNIHPWLMGQAFRIGYLDRLLAHVAGRDDVQLATTDEIATWYTAQQLAPTS